MKTLKTLIFSTIMMASAATMHAATPQNMRFHCSNDTTLINDLLKKGLDSGITDPNQLIAQYGRWLIGTPYVAHTLEGDTEKLTLNIDELDCTTFVETLYALARTTLSQRYSWRDFAHNLESVRYRGGEMNGYASRLHYISDWIIDNNHRGNLKEVTADMNGVRHEVKTINFMSKNRSKYPALSDDATFQSIKNVEIGYHNHRYSMIKPEWTNMKKLMQDLEEGDIVGIVTKIEGLDIQHMGVIVKENNQVYLLNASSSDGKVQIEKDHIIEYMRRNKTAIGLRIFRMME